MGKKLEVDISEVLYHTLQKDAEDAGISLEEYINRKLNEGFESKKVQTVKQILIKELQDTIKRVEAIKYDELEIENKNSKILVYSYQSLKQHSNAIPQEIVKKIDHYKEKGWFYEELFHLIICKKEIVGLLAMQPQEEPMPYGKYLFIYGLYLDKSLQSKKNMNYLAGYIQAIAKQEKTMNVDISNIGTNLSKDVLKGMGFYNFASSILIKGIVKREGVNESPVVINREEIQMTKGVLEEYLLTERLLPLELLMKGWSQRQNPLTTEKLTLSLDNKENLSFILVTERLTLEEDVVSKYILLIEPVNLYDIDILEGIYIHTIQGALQDGEGCTIHLCIPNEINHLESLFSEPNIKKAKWYRKLITS